MEGLYFEVKPRKDDPSRPGTSEKPCPNLTSDLCSYLSPSHLTSSTLGPEKLASARKRVTTSGNKLEEEGEDDGDEVQYKLTLIGYLPVHYLTTMSMLPWVVAEINKSQPSEKEPNAGLQSKGIRGGMLDPTNHTILLCVSASWVQCVSILEEGVVWDPLTHTVLFECCPHQVTKLIHNSQDPSSFGCLVRDSHNCACYVFRCLDSTKVSVCVSVGVGVG